MARPLLILDFDGTLCLGDGPVRVYAAEVAKEVGAAPSALSAALDAFFGGSDEPGELGGAADGYSAVAQWGRRRGLDSSGLSRAFLRARPAVESGEIPVYAPEGAVEILSAWNNFDRVLVTNAPQTGTELLVERLGLAGSLDAIIGDACKPDGLRALLADSGRLALSNYAPVVSVGDIWVNDLEPVAQLGGITALIERHSQPEAAPMFRGAGLQEVFEQLEAWRNAPPSRA